MKKVITIIMVAALLVFACSGTCFAATTNVKEAGANTVPAILNLAATSIDFNISENILLTGESNSVTLTCTDLEVVNNLSAGIIKVTSVTASAITGWTLAESTIDFAALPQNSKTLSLVCEGTDLAISSYGPAAAIEPKDTGKYAFVAKTGITSAQITDLTVANVVATVAMA